MKCKFGFFCPPFCALQKGGKAAKPQKDLIGLREVVIFVRWFEVCRTSELPKGNGFILFACTKRTKSSPEVCEPLDSGDDSNLRSIRNFRWNDRRSSCNRLCRELQPFRVSTVRIWIGAKGWLYCWRKTADFRKKVVVLQAHSRGAQMKFVAAR